MKFGWGTGIFIFLIFFILSMLGLVYITFQSEVNLVTPDYYPKGINYQDQIDKEDRTANLSIGLKIEQDKNNLTLVFPSKYGDKDFDGNIEGDILLFFPKSYRFDKQYNISLNSDLKQTISKDSITWGRCIIKVNWTADNLDYYQETEFMLK